MGHHWAKMNDSFFIGNIRKSWNPGYINQSFDFFPGSSLNATSDLTFRLLAYRDNGPHTDGAGIQQVEFRICRNDCDDDKNVVYRRTEQNAAYCAFGGGEPTCTIFHFTRGTHWPDTNTLVQSGNYVVEARVRPKEGDAYWQGQIEFKISLP